MIITENHQPSRIAVIGADPRQQELAEELKLRFRPTAVMQLDSPAQLPGAVDFIILPITSLELMSDGKLQWLESIDTRTKLLVGRTIDEFITQCELRNIRAVSYLERTEFKISNAVPTAEGAIKLYMEHSNQTVFDSRMLILGFGHCGKALALRLKDLGADVTVFARRSEDRVFGKTLGLDMREYKDLPKLVRERTCIFNTVPQLILDASILSKMPKSSLIIDLASKPGGTDFELCKQLQLNAYHELSLPGRFFPKTAGKILADTVVNLVNEV